MIDLQPLGFRQRSAQTGGDITGEMAAADWKHRGMHHGAVVENDYVGGASAYIYQRNP